MQCTRKASPGTAYGWQHQEGEIGQPLESAESPMPYFSMYGIPKSREEICIGDLPNEAMISLIRGMSSEEAYELCIKQRRLHTLCRNDSIIRDRINEFLVLRRQKKLDDAKIARNIQSPVTNSDVLKDETMILFARAQIVTKRP